MARSRSSIGLPVVPSEPEVPLYDGDMEADLRIVSRNKLAETITGGLSFPSKMPCPSWGVSATRCRVDSVLARRSGTVCSECYATRGRYAFPSTQEKLEQRYRGLFHPLWTPAMVFLVGYYCDQYFRLFDSGDLQGISHLRNLITLARHVPDVQMWLPTREHETVRSCASEIPENLIVRVSAQQIDGQPPSWWPTTSTVVSAQQAGPGVCPAKDQDNQCQECRACWDREVRNVAYRLH